MGSEAQRVTTAWAATQAETQICSQRGQRCPPPQRSRSHRPWGQTPSASQQTGRNTGIDRHDSLIVGHLVMESTRTSVATHSHAHMSVATKPAAWTACPSGSVVQGFWSARHKRVTKEALWCNNIGLQGKGGLSPACPHLPLEGQAQPPSQG